MREIKFKVIDKKTGKYIATEELINGEWVTWYNEFTGSYLDRIETKGIVKTTFPVVRVQFTGLKKHNGKEIYEGDVLKIKETDEHIGGVHEVVFYTGAFVSHNIIHSDIKQAPKHLLRDLLNNEEVEIIGNIYENKEELLEK